jgi:hypothetical protein
MDATAAVGPWLHCPPGQATNCFLFQENLMPRLQRLGLISDRVAPQYREMGLLT